MVRFHAALGMTWKQRAHPCVSTGRSIHAVPSITPSPREAIEDGLARVVGSPKRGNSPPSPREGRLTASPDLTAIMDVTCPSGRLPVPRATRGTFMRAPALDLAMQYLLILFVAVTMACGAAASVTISLAPAYVADNGEGY